MVGVGTLLLNHDAAGDVRKPTSQSTKRKGPFDISEDINSKTGVNAKAPKLIKTDV